MADAARCVVCSKPILPRERVSTGEDVHTACDRRTHARGADGVKCIVCNEPIRSQDGTARLDDVLVHGRCYVRARQPGASPPARKPGAPAANGAGVAALDVGWAHRFLRRVFGPRPRAR